MHPVVGRLARKGSRWLYARTHKSAPPEWLRVAYRVPRQVVLLTARHGGRDNVWPIDWHVPLSLEPRLYGVSLTTTTFGTSLVRGSGAFVVNFVPADWEDRILRLGTLKGADVDKFEAAGLRRAPARELDAPRVEGALGWLECRVEAEHPAGDHVFVVGRVVAAELPDDTPQLHHTTTDARR